MTFQFDSLDAFLAMGGHAPFVWGAWGLSVAVIAGLALWQARAARRAAARIATLEALLERKDPA